MTLLDLYEPLFQYICTLNRMSRRSGGETTDYATVRATVTRLLDAVKQQAQSSQALAAQVAKLEMPVIFFVDSIIAESKLPCAAEWHRNRLAFAQNELAGDEKFFDLLEETMKDSSKDAAERLVIYFVCIGLGFTGWYSGQPEFLRRKMETISKRLAGTTEFESASRICPEAYEYLNTQNLIEPPTSKIGAILIGFLALSFVAVAVNLYLFHTATQGLTESLKEILRHDLIR